MQRRPLPFFAFSAAVALPLLINCSVSDDGGPDTGTGGSGSATAGATTGPSAGTTSTTGGNPAVAGSGASAAGTTSNGGMTSTAGANGTAGAGVAGSFVGGGTGGGPAIPALDCGKSGTALENQGPPANRLNYVIVADGYSEQELAAGGTLDKHMEAMLAKRFSDPIGQPYLRYRNFINICVLRMPSTPICGSSKFGCCGDDQSRLANCNTGSVNSAITANLPASFEVDWRSVVLNGSSWWNSGGTVMMWSGGNKDAGGAAATTSSPMNTATANKAASPGKPPMASTSASPTSRAKTSGTAGSTSPKPPAPACRAFSRATAGRRGAPPTTP